MTDEYWMQMALELAHQAQAKKEVPVGALLVRNNECIGRGWNQPIGNSDPTAHAEIMALRDAASTLHNYRLVDTTLYVTLEPCAMCTGALVHARVDRLVFGALDPKSGAVKSVFNLLDESRLNHKVSYESGVLSEACGCLLKNFFKNKR